MLAGNVSIPSQEAKPLDKKRTTALPQNDKTEEPLQGEKPSIVAEPIPQKIENRQAVIDEIWNLYYAELDVQSPRHAVILSQATYEMRKDSMLVVLASTTQEDVFKNEMLQELRRRVCERLSISSLPIVVSLAELGEKTTKPYTESQKYNYLLEKNQHLAKLKERFNLNIKNR